MLRRCALELSSSLKWKLRTPLSSKAHFGPRKAFSTASRPPQDHSAASLASKLLLGAIAVGAAVLSAQEAGYIDISGIYGGRRSEPIHQEDAPRELELDWGRKNNVELTGAEAADEINNSEVHAVDPDAAELETSLIADTVDRNVGKPETEHVASEKGPVEEVSLSVVPSIPPTDVMQENVVADESKGVLFEEDAGAESSMASSEPSLDAVKVPEESDLEITSSDGRSPVADEAADGNVTAPEVLPEQINDIGTQEPEPLAKSYLLLEEENPEIPSKENASANSAPSSSDKGGIADKEVSKDEPASNKIVLDLIEAIHTAEKRQAELDFQLHEEEKGQIKEKYEKELRDVRAMELMYAEEAAILEKELNKEKIKAAATVKAIQEKAEQKLKIELQSKEEEAEKQLKKARELAKAELNAAIASEKSSQLEKIAEANLHINALCMAFYARSEEARQNHSVHKLALGTLALEEALSKGLPIQEEVEALRRSLVDTKADSLIDLVLSSLPNETVCNGIDTSLQLHQKFDALKGTIRHFGLIPPDGGGILTHAFARIASFIKVKESNTSGDGTESVISKVEKLLSEGKLAEAADTLERGVSGTEAEGAVGDWAKRTKDRAIVEQAVTLIRSYTSTVSLT